MLSFIEGIIVAAKRNGATPALITGNRSISYSELLDSIARISNHFASRGLAPRSKVFINIADPDLRLIVMIAAMHCGLIPFALLDIGDLKDEVDHDFVVGSAALQVPDLAPDIIVDQSVMAGRLSDGVLRDFPDRSDDEILFIGSTTGSTGRRKLLAETSGSFRIRSERTGLIPGVGIRGGHVPLEWTCDDRFLCTLGDVTYAGVSTVLSALTAGGTNVRMSRDPLDSLRLINLFGVTWILTTPGTIAELMDRMDEHGLHCPSVERIMLVGSLFGTPLVSRIEGHFDAEIYVAYGASEIGGIATGAVTAADFTFGYVGQLSPNVKLVTAGSRDDPAPLVIVRDPETYVPYYAKGKAVPSNETFYTLPDLGYTDGLSVYLVGRDDEVYNINGNKTAFSTIDRDLRTMPGVKDVAVVSASPIGDPLGLVIGIVATDAPDVPALAARVCQTVNAPSARSHIHLFRIDKVPRNAFGKTDRNHLIEAFRQASPDKK